MAQAPTTRSRRHALDLVPDPFQGVFRLFTSVRFALLIIGVLAVAGLVGVLVPQMPQQVRFSPAARADWLAEQRERFGGSGRVLERLDLFDVFNSTWFALALAVLVVGVSVCTANRWAPTWRNATRPQRRVADRYYQQARHRAEFPTPPEPRALEEALRRRRYRVERFEEAEATYLFADRFAWAQMFTFVSHLALVLLLLGGFISKLTTKQTFVFAAEGRSAIVFKPGDPDHMQLYVERAVGQFDERGRPLDYRTELTVYRQGREVAQGVATVNDPFSYGGFRFHQTAFSRGYGLRIRDVGEDRVLYSDALQFTNTLASPRVVLTDPQGRPVLDRHLVLTDFLPGIRAAGTLLELPQSGALLWVGVIYPKGEGATEDRSPRLAVYEANPGPGSQPFAAELALGEAAQAHGYTLSFADLAGFPAERLSNLPGAPGEVIVQAAADEKGEQYLLLIGVDRGPLELREGQPVAVNGVEYEYTGPMDFSGITVRRDPAVNIIWVAVGLFLAGLLVTLYVPRRRLWVKVTPERTYMAGQAGHLVNLSREMRRLAAEAGSLPAALDSEDEEEEDEDEE